MNNQTIEAAQKALRNAPEGIYNQKALKGVYAKTPKELIQVFYSKGKHGVSDALANCAKAGYEALYIPELALTRVGAEQGSKVLTKWYLTPSLRVTGTTKQGSRISLYVHMPTDFNRLENIRNVVEEGKLVNGAGFISQEEFNRLESLNGNERVFLVPYKTLKGSSSGVISVDDALDHPQTIPFLGGVDKAKAYLAKHKQVCGSIIGIWHSDDFNKKDPLGRVLYLGFSNGLDGNGNLDNDGQVFGVALGTQVVSENLETRFGK